MLTADLESSEDDVPLRELSSSHPVPTTPARAVSSNELLTHVEDLQDPNDNGKDSEDDLSGDELDPEAREQAVAEQSESDDEVLTSMEARGDAEGLGVQLAAEVSGLSVRFIGDGHSRSPKQPKWSKTEQKKSKGKRVSSDDDASDSEPARVVRLQVSLQVSRYKSCMDVDQGRDDMVHRRRARRSRTVRVRR